MLVRDRQTNQFKKVYVKALDSLPVGAEIDFEGTDIPAGWEEVNGFNLVGYTLYENATGSNGDITLSDSVNNYEYIEIYFTSSGYAGSKKIDLSTSTSFMINLPFIYNNGYYDRMSKYSISGNTITYNSSININSNFSSVITGYNEILIKKIIGYKEA